jgi:hypothetical protein
MLSFNFGVILELLLTLPTWILLENYLCGKVCFVRFRINNYITIASYTSKKCLVFFVDVPPGIQYGGILATFTQDASILTKSRDI